MKYLRKIYLPCWQIFCVNIDATQETEMIKEELLHRRLDVLHPPEINNLPEMHRHRTMIGVPVNLVETETEERGVDSPDGAEEPEAMPSLEEATETVTVIRMTGLTVEAVTAAVMTDVKDKVAEAGPLWVIKDLVQDQLIMTDLNMWNADTQEIIRTSTAENTYA